MFGGVLGGFEKIVNCEFQSGIKEDYKSSSSEFGIANPEQHENPEQLVFIRYIHVTAMMRSLSCLKHRRASLPLASADGLVSVLVIF